MSFNFTRGKRLYTGGGGSTKDKEVDDQKSEEKPQELFVALLDDEYFSFPEVSQVWGEANCTDVVKASKNAIQLDWPQLKKPGGQHLHVPLVEKVRPRWWYIALVSCSNHAVEIAYNIHLNNRRQGSQSEFSMDSIGVLATTVCFNVIFAVLLLT